MGAELTVNLGKGNKLTVKIDDRTATPAEIIQMGNALIAIGVAATKAIEALK